MLPVGIPGRKLNGQFRDAVNKPTVLVAGIILFTSRSGIHRPDTVRLIKSGTIQMVQPIQTWGDLCKAGTGQIDGPILFRSLMNFRF